MIHRFRYGRSQNSTRLSVRRSVGIAVCAGALLLPTCVLASASETLDAVWATERRDALVHLLAATKDAEQCRAATTGQVAAAEATAAAIKADLAALQQQLLGVMSKDDPVALHVLRAQLAARQTALDAEEGAMALAQRKADEMERERDVWKRRAATLELALRMDMKVMLAPPIEIEDRAKRVEAAAKEIETQAAQIRKYASRRDGVAARREIYCRRLAALTAVGSAAGASADLQLARKDEAGQLRRLIAQQEESFRWNRMLETRARRNLAFARADYLISQRFAQALAHKGDVRHANELQAVAERGDAQLALLRTALAPVQQTVASNLVVAAGEADGALKAIGEARTAQEVEHAHAAYAQTQARKGRWEMEAECWKEFAALQKSGVSLAHERADRARNLTDDRSIDDINQEEQQLRASLIASEQYVHNLELLLQRADAQIETTGHALDLDPAHITELAAPLADLFASYDATHPPAPALLADLLQSLAERMPATVKPSGHLRPERRREEGALLVACLAQREMLRMRKEISEHWLENSRKAIQSLEQLAGHQLWLQHDPRLNAMACRETLSLAGALAGGARFVWECWSHRIAGLPGVPDLWKTIAGIGVIVLLGMAGWMVARFLSPKDRLQRLVRPLLAQLPWVLAGSWFAFRLGHGKTALTGLGWLLLALAGWVVVRNLLLVGTRDHRAPSGDKLSGALFVAADAILLWTALLLPFYVRAGGAVNAWALQAVLLRVWLFGTCLALFRLVLHPVLAGRFLSRHSKNRGLRWLGNIGAIACLLIAALVAITFFAGLDTLGHSVLHAAEGTFAALVAAVATAALLDRLFRHKAASSDKVLALVRVAQTLVLLAAAGTVACIWWLLLNRAVLANNAPPPVPDVVHAVAKTLHALGRVWHTELATGVTVASVTRALVVVILSFWFAGQVKGAMHRRVLSRTPMDDATRKTFADVSGWLVILTGFLIGMNVAGSSLQNLALLAGAITVGVGFGLQNVINNFVSSLMIHFSRSIRVGDYIEVGTIRGTVKEIGMRNTVLLTDDEITVLVPNGSFITSNIVNWTNPTRRTRLHIPVVVTRQADLTAVAEMAVAESGRQPLVMKNPVPVLEVRSVTATQVSMELLIWSERPEKSGSIVGEITLALDRALRERGFGV